jgi:hypothetical protein
MIAADARIGDANRPTILVMVVPYVLATSLAYIMRSDYHVIAPNLDAGERPPLRRWDAVLTMGAAQVSKSLSQLIIELPEASFDTPVTVTANDSRSFVTVSRAHPIEDVVALVGQHLSLPRRTPEGAP